MFLKPRSAPHDRRVGAGVLSGDWPLASSVSVMLPSDMCGSPFASPRRRPRPNCVGLGWITRPTVVSRVNLQTGQKLLLLGPSGFRSDGPPAVREDPRATMCDSVAASLKA